MLYHQFLIAWRNIKRNKFYSLLLIIGFAIGIASSILLFSYTLYELSYDRFHENKERIYLVGVNSKNGDDSYKSGWTAPPTGPKMKEYFPEIETYTRVCFWFDEVVVKRDEYKFVEDKTLAVDSSFFNVFTVPFLEGDPQTALAQPNSIVITKEIADKYFPGESPLGKTLTFDHFLRDCVITGLIDEYPDNSHLKFNMLVSLATFKNINFNFEDSWSNHTFSTYVLLNKHSDPQVLESKFPGFLKTMMEPIYLKNYDKSYDEYFTGGDFYEHYLVPLPDVHLSTLIFGSQEGKKVMTYALGIIGFIIIIMVCINYLNLNIALSMKRIKEMGIRKIAGSSRFMIIRQFLIESFIIIFFALLIGLLVLELVSPTFNNLVGWNLKLVLLDPMFLLLLAAGLIILVLLSGYYPAHIVSALKPSHALKGSHTMPDKNSSFGSALIIFQFSICIFMFIATGLIYKQVSFMANKDTGFDKEQVLVVKRINGLGKNLEIFKNTLLENPDVLSVSYTNTIPGKDFDGHGQHFSGNALDDWQTNMPLMGDEDIFKTLGLEVSEGRVFDGDDENVALLNERAISKFNLENPLEKIIDQGTKGKQEIRIIGVVSDFNFQSFHNQIEPLVIFKSNLNDVRELNYALIKLGGANIAQNIDFVKKNWGKHSDDYIFEYTFLDQEFNKVFEKEKVTSELFAAFSIIAMVISILGVMGIAALFATNKTKEIGIRKVSGASTFHILSMFNRKFLYRILAAFLIACPLALYATNAWLTNFAYRTQLSWWLFALAGLVTAIVTMMIVSIQSYEAANANPVNSLRSE